MCVEDRWKAVRQHQLCRRCLGSHGRWPCKADVCGVGRCLENHHRLLHSPKQNPSERSTVSSNTVSLHHLSHESTLFRVIPIRLYGRSRSVETFAFLDDGSSITMMEQELADQLAERGKPNQLCLQWTGGVTKRINDAQVMTLKISGRDVQKQYTLNDVYTVDNLDLPVQLFCHEDMAKKHPHLQGIPVGSYRQATPRVLIGLSNVKLLTSLKTREGRQGEPVASKTRLGWTVYGSNSSRSAQYMHRTLHISTKSPDEELNELVKQYFSVESFGVAVVPVAEGSEDRRARIILEDTTVRTRSGKFETGLLWRHDYVEFPDSRPAAVKRLVGLEHKLSKNLYEKVREQICQYEIKAYAHRATIDELKRFDPRRTWFLPLGVALNPRKPEKVRVVWDVAAKVNGVSLNSKLMKGPDLTASLTAVLFLFRQRQVTGDIKEMFHQLYIRQQDRQSQLFLWRDEPTKPIETYVIDVATFGSTCSPCYAQYIKNRNAEEHREEYPNAADAIIKNHYVDDYLDSQDTPEEVIRLLLQVKKVHQRAGFEIRNWLSNSKDVLRRVGDSIPTLSKNFVVGKEEGMERVLGIVWIPRDDMFRFTIVFRSDVQDIVESDDVPTKRQVLRAVMSIFDPLGLIASVTIHGKILVQELWRQKIGWDDCIPENIWGKWKRWI
ncbi:uncharacterized protein LOC129766664 [Toxorhynchites rutilus septentrionalis]|uniref:uncharacterized protein LOC129766664 n=1 Tax=Toxorhynchites rutilus septentrionalis TaxID=329112 RepID=UPI00247AE262|nr:uncharacterized protein LOC129766664 [Toxorhynchites rutilus septentrionalis]